MKTCPDCNGDGVIEKGTDDEEQCSRCGGSGFVPNDNDDKNNEEVIRTVSLGRDKLVAHARQATSSLFFLRMPWIEKSKPPRNEREGRAVVIEGRNSEDTHCERWSE
jgi:hypothetical protein